MTTLLLKDLPQYSDVLRLPGGKSVTIRFVESRDAADLQTYFRSLSVHSRYNRFLGAVGELPRTELEKSLRIGEGNGFAAIATAISDGIETIVGEVRYAFDAQIARFEFGMSVDDRWHGQGMGAALLSNLQCRAAALGAAHMFGDTLRSNAAMMALARKAGFTFVPSPGDWKLVRLEKKIDIAPQDIPCASWRLASEQAAQYAAV